MGSCCTKSAADKDERDIPQDDLPLSTLTTEEQKESTETGTDGEVTDTEGKEEREGSSSTEEITDASQPQPPLPSPLPVSNEETREKEEVEEEEEEEEEEEDLATGGEAKRESEPKEGEIIPPLPSPYQTFPFTPSLDESEPPTLENEGSLDNPIQEATDTEESIPNSTKKGEKAVSNSLISYDIITEVDPKSLESNARKVNIAKESNGSSNMNKEVSDLRKPDEEKYTSFEKEKKKREEKKKTPKDKDDFRTEVIRIEDKEGTSDEFVNVEYN